MCDKPSCAAQRGKTRCYPQRGETRCYPQQGETRCYPQRLAWCEICLNVDALLDQR